MSRVSTFAGSSFSPERMFRSTTAPVSKFLNLVRVNAAPLPGLTNWNSTTVYGFPSIKTLRPLRISDVSYMAQDVYPAVDGAVKPRISVYKDRGDRGRLLSPARAARPRRVSCGGRPGGARATPRPRRHAGPRTAGLRGRDRRGH